MDYVDSIHKTISNLILFFNIYACIYIYTHTYVYISYDAFISTYSVYTDIMI